MENPIKVSPDITVLPSYFPIPGFGLVPVNAFVLKSAQPVLIDTGLHQDATVFMESLSSVIDPNDLRWLWLTHPDQDHVGSLRAVLDAVPHLRLVTTFLGYGILSLFESIPLERVYLLNPGEDLDVGDRTLTAVRPPSYDNPATTGFYDNKSRAFFSSDCFGALVSAPSDNAASMKAEELREGQLLWGTIDAPWLHQVDKGKFAAGLNAVRQMAPDMVLSSHLPPAQSMTERLLASLAAVPDATPFVGPNQVALEAMLAQMTQGAPVPA